MFVIAAPKFIIMNNNIQERDLERAIHELSALPSFSVVRAWVDDRRENCIASLSASGISNEEMRFMSGYLNMTEEIREKMLAYWRGGNSYQGTEAPRSGSVDGKTGGAR
jgi:hypothetical protein